MLLVAVLQCCLAESADAQELAAEVLAAAAHWEADERLMAVCNNFMAQAVNAEEDDGMGEGPGPGPGPGPGHSFPGGDDPEAGVVRVPSKWLPSRQEP
jgi:hypothetical protein